MRPYLLMVGVAVVTIAASLACATDAPGPTRPAPGLTQGGAVMAFGGAVMDCLQSRMGGQTLRDLSDTAAIKLNAATEQDRKWAPPWTRPETPAWTTQPLGSLMVLTEPTADRCEISATQLPVDSTFRSVAFALGKAFPEMRRVTVKPGYDPIVYEFEMTQADAKYVVHMEGAEPGTPGHALRFSLLYAYVLRQPANSGASAR
jgi:hypothetical protein